MLRKIFCSDVNGEKTFWVSDEKIQSFIGRDINCAVVLEPRNRVGCVVQENKPEASEISREERLV